MSSHDQDVGVIRVDQHCKDATNLPTRFAQFGNCIRPAAQDLSDNLFHLVTVGTDIAELSGKGARTRYCFKASEIPARTLDVFVSGNVDMTNVARRAVRTAMDVAIDHHPAADTCADFD